MGFWKTLFRVCTGREVFLQLLDCGFGKALLHLLCLFLLLAFCLAWGHSCKFSPQMRRMTASLFGEIGSIRFVENKGIRTEKRPEEKQGYLLDHDVRFDYYPGSSLTEADTAGWKGAGLVVMDKGMIFWMSDPGGEESGRYWVMPAPLDRAADPVMPPAESSRTGMPRRALYDYLKTNFEHRADQPLHFGLPDATQGLVAEYLSTLYAVMVFFLALFMMAMLTGITILFFGFMQLVMSAFGGPALSLRQIAVVLIYIAFPALLIASVYSFFMIPLILPQMVFFAVYLLYYLAVFRKIRLTLDPPSRETPDDFN